MRLLILTLTFVGCIGRRILFSPETAQEVFTMKENHIMHFFPSTNAYLQEAHNCTWVDTEMHSKNQKILQYFSITPPYPNMSLYALVDTRFHNIQIQMHSERPTC